jgi:hypothetical protein
MKSKDQTLLEEAYVKVQLNEGLAETILKPIFNKLAVKLKEKAPEVFDKLASAKNSEELLRMLNEYKKDMINKEDVESQQNESVMDVVNKVKKVAGEILEALTHPIGAGPLMYLIGKLIMVVGKETGDGQMAIAGGATWVGGLFLLSLYGVVEAIKKR